MNELDNIIPSVRKNCAISDARHAGNYTMCTFLMKMREYYRWECQLPYSSALSRDDIGEWLVKREQQWQEIEDQDYVSIPLASSETAHDPFDVDPINEALVPQGYVYSGGHGLFCKPHFFLAELKQHKEVDGTHVMIAGREFARDLVAPPAMSQGNTVFLREESIRRYLWEKIEEWRWSKSRPGPMANVLSPWQELSEIDDILDELTISESNNMLLHEIGEIRSRKMLGDEWLSMLSAFAGTRAEIYLRAVKDMYADYMVTLPELLANAQDRDLHLYFSNFSGLRKAMHPELREAYNQWSNSGDLTALNDEITAGHKRFSADAQWCLEQFSNQGVDARATIEARLDEVK